MLALYKNISHLAPEACKLDKTGDLSFFKQQDTVVNSDINQNHAKQTFKNYFFI